METRNAVGPVGQPKLMMNRTHRVTNPEHLTTFNGSELIPIYCMETLPGGTYKLDIGTITRMPALKHPIMGKLWLDCLAFYVPYDLVDQKFDKLIGEGHDNTFTEALFGRGSHNPNPESVGASITPDLFVPHIEKTAGTKDFEVNLDSSDIKILEVSRLLNYLGLPPSTGKGMVNYNAGYDEYISSYWLRAYNLIYSCHFRHPFLDNPLITDFDQPVTYLYDTDEKTGDITPRYKLLRVNRSPDYFSKGFVRSQLNTGIGIDLGGELPVKFEGSGLFPVTLDDTFISVGITDDRSPGSFGDGVLIPNTSSGGGLNASIIERYNFKPKYKDIYHYGSGAVSGSNHDFSSFSDTYTYKKVANVSGVTGIADISSAIAKVDAVAQISINQLRNAIVLQHISERALYGTDMKTILRTSFAVDLPDYRLDEPLFIGGRRVPIQINQVTNTTNTIDSEGELLVPTGEYAGQSTTIDNLSGVNGDNIFFTAYNYGVIMVLVVVRHESVYQYGIAPGLKKHDKFDFYWPEFAGLSNIQIKELFLYRSGVDHDDNRTFNFGPYGIEYLNDANRVSGDFLSVKQASLDDWHLADIYDSAPHFSADWMKDTTKEVLARALALDSSVAPQFMSYFRCTFTRDIPVAITEPGITRI